MLHGYGLYLGSGRSGPIFAPSQHGLLVLGPPRAGKSTSIAIPNVLAANGGVLAVSTKPDLIEATLAARSMLGSCSLFDPSGTVRVEGLRRVGWSPVRSSIAWDDAVLTAESMVGAARRGGRDDRDHWSERAGALLSAMLHAAALEGVGTDELVGRVNRRDSARSLAVLGRHDAELALDLLVGITETDAREQSGIWSTASGVLAAYRTASALESASLPPLDLDGLIDGSDTCYLCAPGDVQAHVAPLVAGLVRQLRSAAYARAREGRGGRRPLVLVLDELANIAPLHDLPALIAEGGSQGVLTLALLQDLSQARARWGGAADGFLSLFGAKVILGGIGDPRTLEAVSLLAGDVSVPVRSTTRGRRRGLRRESSRSVSVRNERLLPPSRLADPPSGRATALFGARVHSITLTPAWSNEPWRTLTARRGGPPVTGHGAGAGADRTTSAANVRERTTSVANDTEGALGPTGEPLEEARSRS